VEYNLRCKFEVLAFLVRVGGNSEFALGNGLLAFLAFGTAGGCVFEDVGGFVFGHG